MSPIPENTKTGAELAAPKGATTRFQAIRKFFNTEYVQSRFADALGQAGAGTYIASVLLAVSESDALQDCSFESIFTAALRAASLRLSCDKATGQAYLIPFGSRATLIVGYKGLMELAVRTNRYRYINVFPIFEGEEVLEDRISGLHRLGGVGKKSNKIVGWLSAFELVAGYAKTFFMTVDEIHEHAKKFSKSYARTDSLWKVDPESMERKTVLRLLLVRWGSFSPADASLLETIEAENEGIRDPIDAQFTEQAGADDLADQDQPGGSIEAPVLVVPNPNSGKKATQLMAELGYPPEG